MSYFTKVSFEQWKKDCGINGLGDAELKEWYDAIKLPQQATSASAGCDFYMPFNLNFEAGSIFRIATGIRWVTDGEGDKGKVLLIFPRSGLGFRYGIRLTNTVGVIDADYCNSDNEGHIIISLENLFLCVKLLLKLVGLFLVDYAACSVCAEESGFESGFLVSVRKELLAVLVLDITKHENKSLFLTGLECKVDSV